MASKENDLAIYILIRSQSVATRVLQRFTKYLDALAKERELTFSTSKTANLLLRKQNEETMEITLRNQTILYKEST